MSIAVGSVEMGQGLNTKVAQTAASILGIPLDMISVKPTNTLATPNAVVTGASIGSEISCYVSFLFNLLGIFFILSFFCRRSRELART